MLHDKWPYWPNWLNSERCLIVKAQGITCPLWDCSKERWQLMNCVSRMEWDADEKIWAGIRKCMNTKAPWDWGDVARVEKDQIELSTWNEMKATIALKTGTVRVILGYIPNDDLLFLPCPLSQRSVATCYHIHFPVWQSVPRSYHPVSTLCTASPHTHRNIGKHTSINVYKAVRQFSLPQNKQTLRGVWACDTHTQQAVAAVLN